MQTIKNLKQVEADVIFVCIHHDGDTAECVQVFPFWECEMNSKSLREYAAQRALEFAEERGCGYVTCEVHDFRNSEVIENIVKSFSGDVE